MTRFYLVPIKTIEFFAPDGTKHVIDVESGECQKQELADDTAKWKAEDKGKPGWCCRCGKPGEVRLHPFSRSHEDIWDYDSWDVWCNQCHEANRMDI